MEIKKPNDVFVAVLQKPDANIFDLSASQMDLSNTQLLKPEEYKRLDKVNEIFKNDKGVFDESKFNTFYNHAANLYQEMASEKQLGKYLEYDPMNFTAPIDRKTIDVRPVAREDFNPYKQYYSKTGVNTITDNGYSLRELAQQGEIFDVTTGEWIEKSAQDLNFFDKFFGDTLVYAQWDDDGEHEDPFTGRTIKHSKGDWKIGRNGSFYIEKLGNREVFGKQIVNPLDILTKEGTKINNIDFFDSDGKEKSIVGTTMKLAAEVAPLLIPIFNTYYGGFKMAMGLASVLPTFYKAAEGLLLGDHPEGTETTLWKNMNKAEGYMSKFSARSFSDKSSESLFNYEQLGSMVSDVFSQIYEQRAAASMSKMFYKVNDKATLERLGQITEDVVSEGAYSLAIKSKGQAEDIVKKAFTKGYEHSLINSKRSNLAKSLSLGYMALTQSSEVYGEALASGYDKRTAGFAALMSAAGQFALMRNNRMGDWFLDKTTGFNEMESKAAVVKSTRGLLGKVQEAMDTMELDKIAGKAKLAETFTSFKSKLKSILYDPVSSSEFAENIFKRSIIEGIEEVSEQAVMDVTKGIVDVMSYLGMTGKKGSFGGFGNVFSKEGLQEYVANLVGGMIGGPMFELERSVISPALSGKSVNSNVSYEVQDLIAAGRTQELIKEIQNRKGEFGSTELAPIVSKVGDGDPVYLTTDKVSQADIIANQAIQQVLYWDKIINTEKLGETDEDIIRKTMIDQIYIDDMTSSGVDKFLLSDVKEIRGNILTIHGELDGLKAAKDYKEGSEKEKELNKKLNDARQEFTDVITGKKAEYYHKLAIFTLNPVLHSPFISMTVDEYVKDTYNKDYYSLQDSEKDKYKAEYEELRKNTDLNLKNTMKNMFNSYLKMNEHFSKVLKGYDNDGYLSVRSEFYKILNDIDEGKIDFVNGLRRLNVINQTLTENGFNKIDLDTDTHISLGKFLVNNGYIKQTLFGKELTDLNNKYFKDIRKLYGTEALTDEHILNNVQIIKDVEDTFKKLKDFGIDADSLTSLELEKVLDINNPGLSEPEISLLKAFAQNYLQPAEHLHNIMLTMTIKGENDVLTDEDHLRLGTDPEEMVVVKDLKKISEELSKLVDQNTKFLDLTNDYIAEAYKSIDLQEEYKEEVIAHLDNMSLSNISFNTETLEEVIRKYVGELDYNFGGATQEHIDALEDESKKLVATKLLGALPLLRRIHADTSNLDYEISARRHFLMEYARQQMKEGTKVDQRIVKELKAESYRIEVALSERYLEYLDGYDEDSFNKLEQEFNELQQLIEYAENPENHKINELYKYLDDFSIEIFGWDGPIKFSQILDDNRKQLAENTFTTADFLRSDLQLEQLKKATYVVKAAKAVLASMSSVEWGIDNLYGMNVLLNKALENEGEAPKYETLRAQESGILLKDLNYIESQLDYFLHLGANNAASFVENDLRIQEAFIKNAAKQYLDKDFKQSLVNLKFGGKSLFTSDDLAKFEEIEDPETKLIEIEDIFYRRFHEHPTSLEEKLKELSNQFVTSYEEMNALKKSSETNLNADFKEFGMFDWFKWIHVLISSNSKKFHWQYKNNIEGENKLETEKKAALYTQALSQRFGMAYFENKSIMSNIAKSVEIELDTPENESDLKGAITKADSFRIENIVVILGSGGTGKSSVIGNAVIRMLRTNNTLGKTLEIQSLAPTQKTLEILSKDLVGSEDVKVKGFEISEMIEQFISTDGITMLNSLKEYLSKNDLTKDTVFGDDLDKYFVAGEGYGAVLIKKAFYKDFSKPIPDTSTRVIIGDEYSKINTLEWQILNNAAKSNNVYILMLGDDLQNGTHIGKNIFGIENITIASSIKMRNPIRAENNLQNENNINLENYVNSIRRETLYNGPKAQESVKISYNDAEGNNLTGTKIVSTIKKEDLQKLDTTKEIAVITNNGEISDDLSKMLKEIFGDKKINIFPREVQGQEFDQVIIDISINDSDFYTKARDLYTILTRAKVAALAKIDTTINIENIFNNNSKVIPVSPEIIKQSLIDRFNKLNSMDLNFEEIKNNTPDPSDPEIEDDEDLKDPDEIDNDDLDPEINWSEDEFKNKTLGYSFFNNLGNFVNSKSKTNPIQEYLDYTVISSDETPNENEITWEDLKSKVGDLTGTDLFDLAINPTNKTVSSIINDYVRFKNAILFNNGVSDGDDINLFGEEVDVSNNWVIKKIYKHEEGKPNTLMSFGKMVNNGIITNDIHAIGTYATVNGKKTFITLATTPDLNNKNTINGLSEKSLETLKDIYSRLDGNNEVSINRHSIKSLHKPFIPSHFGTSKGDKGRFTINTIPFNEIEKKFPGVKIDKSEIKVFWGDTKKIQEAFEYYNGYKITDEKTLESYRFRPFIIINFTDSGVDQSRIILLDNMKRSAVDFYAQFKKAAQLDTDEESGLRTAHLISKFRGWKMLYDFMQYLKDIDKSNEKVTNFANDIKVQFMGDTLSRPIKWDGFADIINSFLKESGSFQEWMNNNEVRKNIVTDQKSYTEREELKWANVLYYADVVISTYAEDFNEFLKKYEDIYYNPIIKSLNVQGIGYGTLKYMGDSSEITSYGMNVAIEPNKLLIDLPNFESKASTAEKKTKAKIKPVSSTVTSSVKTINLETMVDGEIQKFSMQIEKDTPDYLLEAAEKSLNNFLKIMDEAISIKLGQFEDFETGTIKDLKEEITEMFESKYYDIKTQGSKTVAIPKSIKIPVWGNATNRKTDISCKIT